MKQLKMNHICYGMRVIHHTSNWIFFFCTTCTIFVFTSGPSLTTLITVSP